MTSSTPARDLTYDARMVWDMIPCDEVVDTMVKVGLTPPSEDVLTMEHQRSHTRLSRTLQYADRVELMSGTAAEVILATAVGPDVARLSADERAVLKNSYAQMIEIAATAIIANLLDDQATTRSHLRR